MTTSVGIYLSRMALELIEKTTVVVERTSAPQAERAETGKVRSYIPTLDGWRSLAVGLVMGAHCTTMLANNGSKAALLLAAFFDHAGYGVDIFFGLSGFLICTLLLREKERTGAISLGRFYLRRVFRILPPMLLYIACILTLAQFSVLHIERREILAVLFFYRNYIFASWYTMHFWSLAVEEQFYAVVPLFLILLNRKWAIRGAGFLILACITIRWIEFSAASVFTNSLLQWRTENRFDGLLWGVLLALVMHHQVHREWLRKHLNGWVVLAALPVGVAMLTVFTSQPARRTVVAALVPLLIGYTVLHAQSWAGRFLELPLLRWIGRISYSLYIWQMMFLVGGPRPLGRLQDFPFALICPLLCATGSYYLLERPMMRIGHKFAASPGKQPDIRLFKAAA